MQSTIYKSTNVVDGSIQRDVYLRQDIANVVEAVRVSHDSLMGSISVVTSELEAYNSGFQAAINAIVSGFNLTQRGR